MSDPVRWFDWLGSCSSCRKPATGALRGPGNESYGVYCGKCADRRLRKAEKEREKERAESAARAALAKAKEQK